NIAQLVHPSEQTEALQRHRLRLRGEDIPKQYETVFVRKDGRAIPVEVTGARTVWRGELANLTIIRDITKRKETEAALRASEAFSRTLIESTRDGIFCVDRQGRFTFVNDVIVRRSGRPREWWLGRDHIAVLRPQDQALVRRMFESVLTGEVVPPVAAAYETARGQLLHIELNEAPLFDDQGSVIGAMGISRDITERQKTLEALKESEERFRALVQLSPDGIGVHQDGKIVMVNPAGAKLLGYDDPSELIGQPVMEIVHPDDRELVLSRIRQVLEQGKTGELVEERFRTKSGSYVWVEVINGPIIWNNRPAVQVVVRDITEKKELLQRLAEDAAQTRTIIESAPHAVGAECEGRIAYANRIFAELFGYTLKEIIGMPVEQLIAPQDRERLAGYTRERLAGRPAPTHYTFQGLRRDGSTIDLEIYAGEYLLQGKKYTVGFLRKSGKGSPELKP
ncbi:MAG: PAS domain S-box protein, partial [candidate division WOR-3 bacterium]